MVDAGEGPGAPHLAWQRQQAGHDAGDDASAQPRARTQRYFTATRLIVVLALAGVCAAVFCAGIGYGLAHRSDERHAEERRAALRAAVAEFRSSFSADGDIDPRFVRIVEHSAALKGLKFEKDPATDSREMQPVLDASGRIAGFLTWEPDWPMTAMMSRLMPLLAAIAMGLVGFAGYSLYQLRRARRELSASETQARRAAEEDPLTGLPNRRKMLALLDEAMLARIGQKALTFALLELSGLNDLDEQIGMLRREAFLAEAVQRMKDHVPPNVTLCRPGTVEFALIFHDDADARTVLRSIIAAVSDLQRDDSGLRLGGHAGYAQAPRDATNSDELVRRARLALRIAGQKGTGIVTAFERTIDDTSNDQTFIRRELPRAVAAEAFELHYQPIVAADGSRIAGVEALLRWTHPERGAIGPATFIPVAERMGLMDTLGAFVLRRALSEAKRWPGLYVAVNLSPVQVRDRAIVDLVRDVLAETGVAPSRLMLEITEGVLIDNPDEMVRRIEDLRALGVRIALDDFGSGYSNLGYLQRFPFDKLKIDKSFVAPLGRSPNAGVIVQAIVALGRALGVTVLVEGVETEEQRVLLRLAGCDEMQGFLFARPSTASVIDRLLARRKIDRQNAPAATAS